MNLRSAGVIIEREFPIVYEAACPDSEPGIIWGSESDRVRRRIAMGSGGTDISFGRPSRFLLVCWLILVACSNAIHSVGQTSIAHANVIYSTGFEAEEGYDAKISLVGQNNWIGFGSGGNGIVTNFFEGFGQQAYIGFTPPGPKDGIFNVWRPVNLAPISSNQTLIKFSVLMQIVDSLNGAYDDFRWSVYNTNGARFFTLDFDNASLQISYGLDDNAGFVPTGLAYDNEGFYELVVSMNFARNLWSASLNDTVVVNSKPITTTGAALNFGDADAVWALGKAGAAGDNFMIFDNYTITAESGPSISPRLQPMGVSTNGQFRLRVFGEQGLNYVIEASTNLVQWEPIKVISAPTGGVFDFEDSDTSRLGRRYYRAWHRP